MSLHVSNPICEKGHVHVGVNIVTFFGLLIFIILEVLWLAKGIKTTSMHAKNLWRVEYDARYCAESKALHLNLVDTAQYLQNLYPKIAIDSALRTAQEKLPPLPQARCNLWGEVEVYPKREFNHHLHPSFPNWWIRFRNR